MMCAANDVSINAALTLTRGTSDPTRSLGLPLGLTLNADTDGTGPGVAGGTVIISALAPQVTVTGPNAPATINYNPASYAVPNNYLPRFTLTGGATLTQRMLVFPVVTGGTLNTLALKGNPDPGNLFLVADPSSTTSFNTFDPATNRSVSFTGYRLGGVNANQYALATSCCSPIVARTETPGSSFALLGLFGSALSGLYPAGLLPEVTSDAGDNFFAFEEEKEEAVVPRAIPFNPSAPYVQPRYAPKPARN